MMNEPIKINEERLIVKIDLGNKDQIRSLGILKENGYQEKARSLKGDMLILELSK